MRWKPRELRALSFFGCSPQAFYSMKIALINPPSPKRARMSGFPLGLGYVAAYVRKAGHEVRIFDPEPCGMPQETMWKEIVAFGPDIAGITSVTPKFTLARELAIEAKRRLGCLVIMGGPHATALPRSTLESVTGLDAVILGEGEIPLLAVAAEFDARGKVDFNKVPGAAFFEGGQYRETPRPEPISDLDSLPYPARDLLDLGRYYWYGKSATILSSRGCPSQCTFCANICMGRKFRAHSPAYVVGEMEYLVKKHGIRHFRIVDDCFTADMRRVSEICDLMLSKRLRVTWDALGRVSTLRDEAVIRKMKRAGCIYMGLGIETGSQRINDLMKKGTTLEMAEECCAKLRGHGIPYINTFIIGNEGDTEETVEATIAFAKKLKSAISLFGLMIPLPGTDLFSRYYKDYDRPDTDWSDWCSQGADQPYEPRQTALSKKDLVRLKSRAGWKFYFSPFQILRTLVFALRLP